jgi:two-component system sensor histidine kinase KdpD
VTVLVAAISCASLRYLELADVVMIYLLSVVVIAARLGLGPSLLSAALGVLALDYFAIPPVYHFRVEELRHVVTLIGMFIVAAIVSGLTERLRDERERAQKSEHHVSTLYALERELAGARRPEQLAALARRHLARVVGADVAIALPGPDGAPSDVEAPDTTRVPLAGAERVVGAILVPSERFDALRPDERALLEACCRRLADAVDRMAQASETERARLDAETERVRSALLSAVSHDVRTPLAMISASAQVLVRTHDRMDAAARGELLVDIAEQADRLDDLLRDLVAMTRVEAGGLALRAEPGSVEEVVASALRRSERALKDRPVDVRSARGLPLVAMDASLLEQLFVNLLQNATRYSPPGTPVDISMAEVDTSVVVEVEDRGPGVPEDELEKVFEKFYRGRDAPKRDGGVGLGLAICRAIVTAHGGVIRMKNRGGGGASVRVTLPASPMSLQEAALRLPELS